MRVQSCSYAQLQINEHDDDDDDDDDDIDDAASLSAFRASVTRLSCFVAHTSWLVG